jgi:3-methyladenine DNA glycosylase AlkD
VTEIQERLFALQDEDYRAFIAALVPGVEPERIIGVRTPAVRQLAKTLRKEGKTEAFLARLPHHYFEEYGLHAAILCEEKDFARCIGQVERFLPWIDNWATCDGLNPTCFQRNRAELLDHIPTWLASEHPYTVRFGIGMLMSHFLDKDFDPAYLEWVAALCTEEYYVNMMIAWYFATALAKQYGAALPYLESRRLARWTHNKSIQKALESYRVPEQRKAFLRTLRWKKET